MGFLYITVAVAAVSTIGLKEFSRGQAGVALHGKARNIETPPGTRIHTCFCHLIQAYFYLCESGIRKRP